MYFLVEMIALGKHSHPITLSFPISQNTDWVSHLTPQPRRKKLELSTEFKNLELAELLKLKCCLRNFSNFRKCFSYKAYLGLPANICQLSCLWLAYINQLWHRRKQLSRKWDDNNCQYEDSKYKYLFQR